MATTRLYTAQDLYAMDAKARFYIIDGELFEDVSAPVSSIAAVRIVIKVGAFAAHHRLGELQGADGAYVLRENPDTVLIPDLSFVRAERMPPRNEQIKYFRFAPDLAVEVLSPSNRRVEIDRKIAIYREAGVPLVWLVDPFKQTVEVFTATGVRSLTAADTLDGGEVLPGFSLPLAELFA
jgi:Uma2 family endonuclease